MPTNVRKLNSINLNKRDSQQVRLKGTGYRLQVLQYSRERINVGTQYF